MVRERFVSQPVWNKPDGRGDDGKEAEVPMAEEGWVTAGGLATLAKEHGLALSQPTAESLLNAEAIKLGATDHIKERRVRTLRREKVVVGKIFPHYSPQAAAAALKEYEKTPIADEEWLTAGGLATLAEDQGVDLGQEIAVRLLQAAAAKLGIADHAKELKERLSREGKVSGGKISLHYSPQAAVICTPYSRRQVLLV